jgi:hypothetical protein
VGADFSAGFPAVPADAAVTLSDDGAVWTHVADNPTFTAATLGDVASNGSTVVAVGYGKGSPQIWTSVDADNWQRADAASLGGGQVNAVVFGGAKFIAVGAGSQNDAAIWTSDGTGATWAHPASPGSGSLNAVTVSGSLFVAGGKNSSNATMYTSTDGQTWTQTLTDEAMAKNSEVHTVGADASKTVVAFGTASDGSVVLWTGTRSGS